MLSNYSPELQKTFKKKGIDVGQRILVKKGKDEWEGFLIPQSSGDANNIVIKLDNGYNVGIAYTKNTYITKKHEKRAVSKPDVHIKKYKPDKSKPTIALLHTGGTIASRVDYKTGAVTTAFTPEDLYAAVPELTDIANIEIEMVFQLYSQDMETEHWTILANAVEKYIKRGVDGIIITHGTDHIPYTSAALAFSLQNLPIPVLIVGSQRSTDRGSSDAAMNLICAARFIIKTDFSGVAICMHGSMDDEYCYVNDPVNVKKMHTTRRDTFRSVDVYPIAKIHTDGQHEFFRSYNKKDKSRKIISKKTFSKQVAILKSRPGFSYKDIELYSNAGFRGIVLEGTGLGHLPNESHDEYTKHHVKINETIEKLTKKGITILMTSQCPYGRVNLNVYAPLRVLLKSGVIPARMTTEAAFVKLSWILGQTSNAKKIREMLETNYAGEIVERIDPRVFLF
jgi:glutamyl-tRNA(Gln) amidotransferase subunit D